jgi:hypothetical protein
MTALVDEPAHDGVANPIAIAPAAPSTIAPILKFDFRILVSLGFSRSLLQAIHAGRPAKADQQNQTWNPARVK